MILTNRMCGGTFNARIQWLQGDSNLLIPMDLSTEPATRPTVPAKANVVTAPLVIAVAMLSAAACVAGPFASWMNLHQHKQAIALRAPLASLDESSLLPYRVVKRHVLDRVTLEQLGTDMYLSWQIENEDLPPTDPLRSAHLLVTYQSGGNSLVPHTPDVCWIGGGYEPAQAHENVELELASALGNPSSVETPTTSAGKPTLSVPVRVCTFVKTAQRNRTKHTVVYTFHCNGRFVATRDWVRIRINAPTNQYAYFSKVELTFPSATREQSIEGARMLFDRLLPTLVRQHWPDFQAAEDAARSGA